LNIIIRRKRKSIVLSFLCLVLLSFVAVGELAAATRVPDFNFPSVSDRETVDIRDYRGKVVLINFWATWCGPCIKEIPSLAGLQDEFGPQGFSVIGISIDQGGSKVVGKMMKKAGVNYPVVIGNSKLSREFGGVFGVPTSFLVDRAGNVLKRYTGYIGHQVFSDDIVKALK
jgi:thiol-disulfide isomerase/thioredoxin